MREENGKWTPPELAPFSTFDQFAPALSHDGKRLYFASKHAVTDKTTTDINLWYVDRQDGKWSDPEHLGFPPNREGFSEMHPSITEDGTIYFRAFGPGTRGTKMFKSKYIHGNYKKPQSLDDFIDSGCEDDCMNMKYIITYTYGGPRYAEISICFHKPDGRWTKPIYMGDKLHQGQGSSSAGMSPDGKYLFFVQNISPYWVDAKVIEDLKPDELK